MSLQLLLAYQQNFLRFVQRRVGDRALAEDLVQEAFGRAIEHVDSLQHDESVIAWFYRVLRNAVIDHYRRHHVAGRALELLARDLSAAVPPAEVRDAICRCVGTLAGSLKPEYARALQRIEVEGLSVGAFAAESGITPGHAAVRVHRARQALRARVIASCGICAEHRCLDCRCRRRSSEPGQPAAR